MGKLVGGALCCTTGWLLTISWLFRSPQCPETCTQASWPARGSHPVTKRDYFLQITNTSERWISQSSPYMFAWSMLMIPRNNVTSPIKRLVDYSSLYYQIYRDPISKVQNPRSLIHNPK